MYNNLKECRMNNLLEKVRAALGLFPVIAAVNSGCSDISDALESDVQILACVRGDIFDLQREVRAIHACGKRLFVHIDLVRGIGKDECGVKFIAKELKAAGIISTHAQSLKAAHNEGVIALQRILLVDGVAFESSINQLFVNKADMAELMPGILPQYIGILNSRAQRPIIATGLIDEKQQVVEAIKAGAIGVTTSKKTLWYDA